MKSIMTMLLCIVTTITVFAQTTYNTVTINYHGQNRQVIIDGKAYSPTSNLTIVTNDLAPGRHTLQVVRNNNRRSTETAFTLRNNYDLNITVAGNGSVQLKETYRAISAGTRTTPMATAAYNTLTQQVRASTSTSSKISKLNVAFANTSNYFSTSQAKKLIQLVNGESYRLQLAKSAVRSITDTRNLYSLTSVLASQNSRNQLTDYIRSYTEGNTGTTTPPNTTGTAMSATAFNALIADIRTRWQPGAKFTAVSNAFAGNNYFSTTQAMELIQFLSSESERLQLAKASYRTIVDRNNFTQLYNLLGTQASRDDLANYVRSGGTGSTTTTYRTPMSEANFSSMVNQIRGQWLPGAKKREVLNVFANTSNNFTVAQVVQLIQLDSDEADRMDLAKASLRSITDPENVVLLYNVFTTQASRDEIVNYIRVNGMTGSTTGTGSTGTTSTYKTPMAEAQFRTLLDNTKSQWLPGAKKSAILNAFATSGNYFTTSQAMQLIQLDNDEPDRFDMAKASYKVLTDPENFSQLNTLFTNQSYINELAAYIRTVQQ